MSQSQFTDTRVKGVLGCAKGMVGSDQQTQTKCLELALGKDSKAAQLSSCISASNRDYGQRILCAAEGVLTPEKSHALACAVQAKGAAEVAACVPNESLRKALNVDTCIKGGGGKTAIALCVAQAAGIPDPNVAKAVDCMAKNSADYRMSLACIAGGSIPGDAGLIARCAAASGGDPRATAVCAVTPGLTPEQQIALSCAVTATTGPGYAACVGGQLTLREYANCQDNRFAEGACFGEGNEIRRFAKNVLGTDIGPNSVVAHVANVNLDAVKGTVAIAEGVVRDGGQALQAVGDHVGQVATAAGKAVEDLARSAAGGLQVAVNSTTPQITVGSQGVTVQIGPAGSPTITLGAHPGISAGGFHVSL